MDMLDRYLQAVRFFLPARQQDDIVRELSENLVSQMEDRREALGRPLTEDEQADILRRHGHPLLVAGRYRTRQHLIGPAFFPIYLFALKVGVGGALLVTLALGVVAALVTGDAVRQFVEAMKAFPGRALMVFAWTTLGFALVDLAQSRMKLTHAWDPRTLPAIARREHWISRGSALAELFVASAALVWLLIIPGSPHLLFGPAAGALAPAPIWQVVYVPFVLLMAAGAVLGLVNVLRPYWTPVRSFVRIGLQVGMLIVLGVLFRAEVWVLARPGATLPGVDALDRLLEVVNRTFEIGLVIAVIVCLIEIGKEAYRLYSRRSLTDPSHASVTR
jgi:hypothetical protein